jgi:hypothetical protein
VTKGAEARKIGIGDFIDLLPDGTVHREGQERLAWCKDVLIPSVYTLDRQNHWVMRPRTRARTRMCIYMYEYEKASEQAPLSRLGLKHI